MKKPLLFLFITFVYLPARSDAQNPAYIPQLNELIRLYSSGQIKKACLFSDSILINFKSPKNKRDTIYPYILYYSSIVNGLQKNFIKCEKLVPELEEVCLKRYGKNHIKYWSALDFRRMLLLFSIDAKKRLKYQHQSLGILLHIYREIDTGTVKSFDLVYKKEDIRFYIQSTYLGMGITYANLNMHREALSAYKESGKYYDEQYTLFLDPQSFLTDKSTYGSYLLMLEELEQSEKVFGELETWVRKKFNPSHPVYGEMLYKLGNFYFTIGQMSKAERYLLDAKRIFENTFQKDNSDYYFSIFRLSDMYLSGYRAEKMDLFFNELNKVAAKIDPSYRAAFVFSKIFLVEYYQQKKKEQKADSVISILDNFFNGRDFAFHYTYNNYLSIKADQFEKKGLFAQADSVYRLRLAYRENIGVANTKAYARLLLKRSTNFFNWGKATEAVDELKKSIYTINSNLEKTFSFLSEGEKQAYISTTTSIFNQLNAIAYSKQDAELVKLSYNCQLVLKELLLKTSVISNRLHYPGDSSYQSSYEAYSEMRKKLAYQASLPDGERNQYEELTKAAEKMEKKLAKSSMSFIKNKFTPAIVDELQDKLTTHEAAIEFTYFRQGDSTFYVALLLRKNTGPMAVPLFEIKKLNDFFSKTISGPYKETINSRFGKNNELYKMIWQPIEEHLGGIRRIYFSLSGELFKLPVTILSINDSLKICDRYKLIQLNSTSLLVKRIDDNIITGDKLFLYGGIYFDGDSTELIGAASKYGFNSYATRSVSEEFLRGDFWQYLPDTKVEVESIAQMASQENMSSSLFTGWDATEESIKSLTLKNSPELLHFATHGFFFPDPVNRKSNYRLTIGTAFTNSDNPLMRSGICLAGANFAWDNKPLKGIQDGILTSYEISNLDLINTKLVVLSACETGLGDIVEYEGVFGLQRAFKMAGVQNIVMSLWTVPDNSTAEFMIEFYKQLFNKKNIEEAFYQTQSLFRNRFPNDPYRWGAWILIK